MRSVIAVARRHFRFEKADINHHTFRNLFGIVHAAGVDFYAAHVHLSNIYNSFKVRI